MYEMGIGRGWAVYDCGLIYSTTFDRQSSGKFPFNNLDGWELLQSCGLQFS